MWSSPPRIPVRVDSEGQEALREAQRAIGRLLEHSDYVSADLVLTGEPDWDLYHRPEHWMGFSG